MKKNKRLIGAITSFAAASACLIGGTYAWFVVANTAETQIIGTIAEIEDVQIGVKSTKPIIGSTGVKGVDYLAADATELLADFGLIKDADTTNRGDVYWSHDNTATATNGDPLGYFIEDGLLETIANFNGYGTILTPVTTGEYELNDQIQLKKGLDSVPAKAFVNGYTAALPTDYLAYTLVFKTPEENTRIHLKSTGTNVVADAKVISALRVGFTDENSTPSNLTDDVTSIFKYGDTVGETKVGGRMDLNGDNVWDYFELAGKEYEIFYGEFTGFAPSDTTLPNFTDDSTLYGITYSATQVTGGTDKSAIQLGVNDIFLGNANTKSLNGAYTFADHAGLVDATLVQEHNGVGYYIPGQNEIITTNAEGYGALSIKVWVEGWDTNCVNDIESLAYTVNLTFVSVLN